MSESTKSCRLLTIIALGVIAASAASPADWPVFHGNPGLTGYSEVELPDQPEVLWTFTLEQKIPFKASAVISGKFVYAGAFDNFLYCLNIDDGKKIWSADLGGSIEGTSCVSDGIVFTGSHDTNIYAHDALTGKELWKVKTGDAIKGGPNYVDGKCICGSYDNKLYCLAGKTGKEIWNFETTNYINGTPAVADGKTVFGGCDGLIHLVTIADGKEVKNVEAGAYIAGSAALDGGFAYVGQHENEFLAANLESGKIEWSFKSPQGEPFDSTPAVSQDKVVVGCDDKKLYCLNRKDGKLVWQYATKGKISGSPVIVRNRVICGDEKGNLFMLDLAEGKQLWHFQVGGHIDSAPAVTNNLIVVTAGNGTVTAFGSKKPEPAK